MENKILFFKSPDCGVCDVLAPKMEALVAARYPQLAWEVVYSHEAPARAAAHQVFIAPTMLVILEGKEFFRFARNFSARDVQAKLDRVYALLTAD